MCLAKKNAGSTNIRDKRKKARELERGGIDEREVLL